MPTISLRLTDQEHAALKEWAHGSHRSMQREAVYRIFQERLLSERDQAGGGVSMDSRSTRSRSESDRHFKPDFK